MDMKAFMRKHLYKIANFRVFRLVLCSLVTVFGIVGPLYAQQTDSLDRLFTIRELKVDETARRASDARRVALEKVEIIAYEKLLLKVTQPEGRAVLPELSTNEIRALISGIEVVEEQSSSRRYIASLNVRFEPGLVSQFLAEHSVPHVLSTGRGVLVLHAHKDMFSEYLWEPSPEILEARDSVDWVNRIRQYVFPRGELRERAAVTFGEVNNLKARAAYKIAQPLDVQSVLLISTEWVAEESGASLRFKFKSLDGQAEGVGSVEQLTGEREADVLRRGYEIILDKIDSEWRDQLLVDTGVGGELQAIVATSTGDVLSAVEARLGDVTLVNEFRILEVGLPFSVIQFHYTGREDQMMMALRYAGLNIEAYGDRKLISLRSDFIGGTDE
jgi:hypothetical protein